MSKIVQAVNSMVSNPKLISSVIPGENELFFLYKSKYKWSIVKTSTDAYNLWFYPGNESLEELASFGSDDWMGYGLMVKYSTSDIGTKEAFDSFSELYTLVQEKAFGVDEVLDDIIGDDWL